MSSDIDKLEETFGVVQKGSLFGKKGLGKLSEKEKNR